MSPLHAVMHAYYGDVPWCFLSNKVGDKRYSYGLLLPRVCDNSKLALANFIPQHKKLRKEDETLSKDERVWLVCSSEKYDVLCYSGLRFPIWFWASH